VEPCPSKFVDASVLKSTYDNPEIGIVILTHSIKVRIEEEVMARKLHAKNTLLVEVPGPGESIQSDFITRYIRESIGLKL